MRLFLAALIVLGVTGVAEGKERTFVPIAGPNQEQRFVDGTAHVIARGQHGGVVVAYEAGGNNKRGWVTVFVANDSDAPILVSETSIKAFSATSEPLHVYSYAELQKMQSRSDMWSGIAAGLAAGSQNMAAANAGTSYHSGTYGSTTNAQAWGSGGYASGTATTNGSYSGRTYDAGAAYAAREHANEKSQAILDGQRQSAQLERSTLEARTLKANTLEPGAQIVGQIRVDLPKRIRGQAAEFTIQVPVGQESFAVLFRETL